MNIGSMLAAIFVSSLGLAGSVCFFETVIHGADAQAKTSAFALFFVIPLAIFSVPGLTYGLPPLSAFPAKLWIGGSLAAVGVFALYNLTWGFSSFPPLDHTTAVMLIAVGPLFLALVWLFFKATEQQPSALTKN